MFEIGLVILDPLRSVTASVDRGPAELQPLALFERRLINETGCAVWNGHHETKPPASTLNGPDERRPAQRSSGGGLFSMMDAPVSIERIDDMKSRFVPDGFKHDETPAPFIVERLILGDAAFLMVADAPERQTGSDLALVDAVRDFLREHPDSSQAFIQRTLKKQKEAIKTALETLAGNREAFCVPKGKANLWRLR
jgi:hypothetical protein